jgi:hypothetical protein
MRFLPGLMALLLLLPVPVVAGEAGEIDVAASVNLREGVYELTARVTYPLNNDVRAALADGATVRFSLRAVVDRQRRFWLDATVVDVILRRELSWNAVSQRYILRNVQDGAQDSFAALDEALAAIGVVRDWQIAAQPKLEPDETYRIRVRAGYRSSRMPDALRALAFWSDGWSSESEWKSWTLPR